MTSHTTFRQRLTRSFSKSLLCLGLDPDPNKLPLHLRHAISEGDYANVNDVFYDFCVSIVDKAAPFISAIKPQIAFFSAYRAELALEKIISYVKKKYPELLIILDAKRGDIGNTAQQYAIEAFIRYQADAVTLNPYMGYDSVAPFLAYPDKGVFLLCRTSNLGGAEFQEQTLDNGEFLYQNVARHITQNWNSKEKCGLVVGATTPEVLQKVRLQCPHVPLLVPGIGSQQGDLTKTLNAALDDKKQGLLINSSRAILYADSGIHFAEAAAQTARETHEAIEAIRNAA